MTNKDEALKMALEMPFVTQEAKTRFRDEIKRICKEALEQPAQKPVGVVSWHEGTVMGSIFPSSNMPKDGDLIYTHPHQWQGLTDNEITELHHNWITNSDTMYFARAIEAKLKEKNT